METVEGESLGASRGYWRLNTDCTNIPLRNVCYLAVCVVGFKVTFRLGREPYNVRHPSPDVYHKHYGTM
jgi:hypothetical protein